MASATTNEVEVFSPASAAAASVPASRVGQEPVIHGGAGSARATSTEDGSTVGGTAGATIAAPTATPAQATAVPSAARTARSEANWRPAAVRSTGVGGGGMLSVTTTIEHTASPDGSRCLPESCSRPQPLLNASKGPRAMPEGGARPAWSSRLRRANLHRRRAAASEYPAPKPTGKPAIDGGRDPRSAADAGPLAAITLVGPRSRRTRGAGRGWRAPASLDRVLSERIDAAGVPELGRDPTPTPARHRRTPWSPTKARRPAPRTRRSPPPRT